MFKMRKGKKATQDWQNRGGQSALPCHECRCSYTPEKKVPGYARASRQKAIQLYVDGMNLRRIERQLGSILNGCQLGQAVSRKVTGCTCTRQKYIK